MTETYLARPEQRPFDETKRIIGYFKNISPLMGVNQDIYLSYLKKIERRMGFFKLKKVQEGSYFFMPAIRHHFQQIAISQRSIEWIIENDGGNKMPRTRRVILFTFRDKPSMKLTNSTFSNRGRIPDSTMVIKIGNEENFTISDGVSEKSVPRDLAMAGFPEPR